MATKTKINIDEKKNNNKLELMKFAGIWKDNADEWEKIKKKIYEDRKKFKLREVNL